MIDAVYFDGKSAKARAVKIAVQTGQLTIAQADGSVQRLALNRVHVDESFKGAAQRIELGGGALLEVKDTAALHAALAKAGEKLGLVQRAQNSWAWVFGGLAVLVALVTITYLVVIPFGAKHLTTWLPESVDRTIGDQAWPSIEEQLFKPSKLTRERQATLAAQFAQVAAKLTDPPRYQLEFRSSKFGPNAIAVPGGRLVMTDELVALTSDDRAILGVLLHELGHIKRRHSMRNIVQATAVTALITAWFGDISSLVAIVPTAMATMKYSRDFENEADDFAIAALSALQISGQPTADLFNAMAALDRAKNNKSDRADSLFSTHPVTVDRIKKFGDVK